MSFFFTTFNSVYSQSVSPDQAGEFCPNVEYTFTVTIPKTFDNIIGNGGCSVTLPPVVPVGSTFTFKGKFGDTNQKQWFKINYKDGTYYDIEFKKIKSLFYSTQSNANPPCNVIKPNQVRPIIFPRCQVTSAVISFPNIQWFTNFENPEVCFGSVTDYEYLLPLNWQLGTSTSNGITWIEGGNSVTITSDLSTGDGADIRIRASNKTCGIGLAANGPTSTVRISRSRPTISITGDDFISSGSKIYSLTGTLPAGATVCWSSSNPGIASVPASNCGSSVSVSYVASGTATITATVTDCIESYSITKNLTVGSYVTGYWIVSSNYNQPTPNTLYTSNSAIWLPANQYFGVNAYITTPGVLSPSWSMAAGSYPFSWGVSGTTLYFSGYAGSAAYQQRNGIFNLTAQTTCGAFSGSFTWPVIVQGWGSFQVTTSPNPATDVITLTISEESPKVKELSKDEDVSIQLYTFDQSHLVKQWKFKNDQKQFNLKIADVNKGQYVIVVIKGNYKESKQVLIER